MKNILLLASTLFCFLSLTYGQAGELDPSFGNNGVIATDVGESYDYGTTPVTQILLPSDGNIYLIQKDENFISKRLSNGARDIDYGVKGYSTSAGFAINGAAIAPDNKIVAAGNGVVRYNADGKLDNTFSGNGTQKTSFIAGAIAIQKDEKIVIAGISNNYLSLARYKTNGSPDSTFSGDGIVNSQLYYYDNPTSILIQHDGKIVVTGSFTAIIRFNADGSIDNSFNNIQNFESIRSAAIQSDGKIVVTGYAIDSVGSQSVSYSAVGRYNIDGTPDTSFSGDGKQKTDFDAESMALQSDGKIVVSGSIYLHGNNGFYTHFAIARYNSDGTLDESFAGGGMQTTDFGTSAGNNTVAIQPDGKIVAAGSAEPVTDAYSGVDIAIARYNTNGSLDRTFDGDGKLIDHYYAGHTAYKNLIVQKDGKIVTSGSTYNGEVDEMAIVCYNKDGSLDKTFSNNGIQTTGFTGYDEPMSLIIQKDGKIIASSKRNIGRYKTNGGLDSTFSSDGEQHVFLFIKSSALQSDGKIVVGGSDPASLFPVIARYNSTSATDKSFDKDGKQYIPLGDDHAGSVSSLAIQKDGKIVVAGVMANIHYDSPNTSSVFLSRLNTDGSLDSAFGSAGIVILYAGGYATNCSIDIASDGKIVLATNEYNNGSGGTFVTRFNTDGSIDSSFVDKREHRHANYSYVSVAIQNDGKIVVSGSDLLRFNTDGSLDSTFNINATQKVNFAIRDIAIADNKLYVAGGGYYGFIARYLLEGNAAPPTVTLTAPADSAYFIEGTYIKLRAEASDTDGTISNVEFYNGDTLLHTEYVAPYGYQLKDAAAGNYTITARATDNEGQVSISAPVHITVISKDSFNISIVNPANNEVYAAPAYVHLKAEVNNPHGKIARVEFYNGSTLLRNEYKYPYTYVWRNVPEGVYYVTAKAIDEQGFVTTSETITIKVIPRQTIVSSKPYSQNEKTALKDAFYLKLSPNPATHILNIQTSGLQPDKPATLSIISVSGIVLKTIRISNSSIQLDVSTLASGIYTIKIISGGKVSYKQFVKL